MLTVRSYSPELQAVWDGFVRQARNGVFLAERDYMSYHADRFDDASLLVFDGTDVVAALPAHRVAGDGWVSHGGLTFGGLLMHPDGGAADVLAHVDALVASLRERGAQRLLYKPVPHIYHRRPSEDDLYALHRHGARAVRMDLSCTVDLARRPPLAKGRRHALSKARRAGLEVHPSTDYASYWALLNDTLATRHGVEPTHRVHEIERLARRFPQIQLHAAHTPDGTMLAGAVTYHYEGVLHTQYLASNAAGREVGALDAVIAHLLDIAVADCRWLNFGASTADEGRTLNAGLAAQKEMFGGRSTVLQTLELRFDR